MASRQNGSCSKCGGGHGNGHGGGSKGWSIWKIVGVGLAIWFATQYFAASNDGGHSDYRSPSEQSQTTQKKCDPNALLQLGCTP